MAEEKNQGVSQESFEAHGQVEFDQAVAAGADSNCATQARAEYDTCIRNAGGLPLNDPSRTKYYNACVNGYQQALARCQNSE
jgi:hypothetical protein